MFSGDEITNAASFSGGEAERPAGESPRADGTEPLAHAAKPHETGMTAAPNDEAHQLGQGARADDESPASLNAVTAGGDVEAVNDPPSDAQRVGKNGALEKAIEEVPGAEATQPESQPRPPRKRSGKPVEEAPLPEGPGQKEWFILKVQSNREDSICHSLKRRVAMEGLDEYFGEIIVPTESVTEFKSGKKRVVKRKLYPGYIVVHMVLNDDTWFLVRETPGIGDFTGAAGKPMPMQPHEVQRIVSTEEEQSVEAPKLKISFHVGDRVKINEGMFDNFEGNVEAIDETNGRVTVMINIFGRSTPVELEYWQVESL